MCPTSEQHDARPAACQAAVHAVPIGLQLSAPVWREERLRVLSPATETELEDNGVGLWPQVSPQPGVLRLVAPIRIQEFDRGLIRRDVTTVQDALDGLVVNG